LHGGGFLTGSPYTHRPITTNLAALSQRAPLVLSVDYRLAPEHIFPAQLEDALSAYRFLLGECGFTPRHVTFAGDSAGGTLAMQLLLALNRHHLPAPRSVVLFSPWFDLSGESAARFKGDDPMIPVRGVRMAGCLYLGGQLPTKGGQSHQGSDDGD